MTRVRQRMLEEIQRRNYSPETTRSYIHAVKQFAEYFGKSPGKLGAEEIRRYQLYLLNEKKYTAGSVKVHISALHFFYKKVLKRRDLTLDDLVYPKRPKKLPVVLSSEEVARLIEATSHLMHRAVLMLLYGTGIRRTEASRLRVSDIDSQRMVLHQTNAREKWLAKRQGELLPVHYFHLVFSVPHTLVPLMWQNKKILFALLFEASAATLLEVAADPKHLGAGIGFFSILHTWGQTLQPHPHIHCVVPGGGLSPDHQRWLSTAINFFLPVLVLSPVFRGKFLAGLRRAFRTKQLVFHGECLPLAEEEAFSAFLDSLREQDWVVYAKPPFGGPEHVLHYLARYTHRVAISNHRIVAVNESQVLFRWKDYAHHSKQRTMPLTCEEFLRRFVQHVLPKGFPRIRYFGWMANRRRKKLLPLCRDVLPPLVPQSSREPAPPLWRCPRCHAPMAVLERFTATELLDTEGRQECILDTS